MALFAMYLVRKSSHSARFRTSPALCAKKAGLVSGVGEKTIVKTSVPAFLSILSQLRDPPGNVKVVPALRRLEVTPVSGMG